MANIVFVPAIDWEDDEWFVGIGLCRRLELHDDRLYGRSLGDGDLTWQWRDWNEWTAVPMIGRNDDNTMLAAL